MTDLLLQEIILVLLLAIFLVGAFTMLIRRVAVWSLVGQIIAIKSVVAGSFFLASYIGRAPGDLLSLCLLFLGALPTVAAIGLLVLHRCARFGGTLDLEEEDRLRG